MLAYICGANNNLPPMWNFKLAYNTRDCFTSSGENLCDVNTDFKRQLQLHGVNNPPKMEYYHTPKWPRLTSTGQNNRDCVTGVAESLLKKASTSSKQCPSIFILSYT